MGLTKQTIDIVAADGLNQKLDIRRLPQGKSASAVNLVKNKIGRLEKRLGFKPLANTFRTPYAPSDGLNLGTLDQNLFAVTRGLWAPSSSPQISQTVTALHQYSDDGQVQHVKGQLPELRIIVDTPTCEPLNFASSPTCILSGDYLLTVWVDGLPSRFPPTQGDIYFCVSEVSTGNLVYPSTPLTTGGLANCVRAAVVGTGVGAVYIIGVTYTGSSDIDVFTAGAGNLANGPNFGVFPWTAFPAVVNNAVSGGGNYPPIDLRPVTGDTANFLLAYSELDGVQQKIVVDSRPAANPPTLNGKFTAQSGIAGTTAIFAIGVRGDRSITGRVAVAWALQPSLAFPLPGTPFELHAATCTYPAMGFVNGSSTNADLVYTGRSVEEVPPAWLDVAFVGVNFGWVIAHSPFGAVWGNLAPGTGALPQSQPGRIVGSPPLIERCAQIIQNQFLDGANVIVPIATASGANAAITYGPILASRGLEQNGTVYYLGWIPSYTQGGFIAYSFDRGQDFLSDFPYPMRPCGNLQTRTALFDPGTGQIIGHTAPSLVGPNTWGGASEWMVSADVYATSHVGYVTSTAGQRAQPARGQIQCLPQTVFASTPWGSLVGIAGSIPTCFDGQSVFEQSFLWGPESTVVVMGTPIVGAGEGPKWVNDQDSYSWIFCWEQFDNHGNYHISARGVPVGITYYASSPPPGQLNTAGRYHPTFYVPTLSTLRQSPTSGAINGNSFWDEQSFPTSPVTLGVYRTTVNGSVFYRVADRFYNGDDPQTPTFSNAFAGNTQPIAAFVSYTDRMSDDATSSQTPPIGVDDGTHPQLYGDGTNGQPGSIDNFCPPASDIMIRHKERLFLVQGNTVFYTKQRGQLSGPGYDDIVQSFFVGSDEAIIAMESMDDKLIIFKPNQIYYVSGDGPADDGSGNSYSPPQPIPTDSGCSDPASVRSTPEGVYFMSYAGLRLLTRSLSVEYVGGPVEDELIAYPMVRSAVLYPGQNRVVFAVMSGDTTTDGGELIYRDYVLDAWTTAVINDNSAIRYPAALAVANAPVLGVPLSAGTVTQQPVLHFLTPQGVVWRERDPNEATPFYDNNTYVSWHWASAMIKPSDQGRFRMWDIITWGQSVNPHGLLITVFDNYDPLHGQQRTWVWNNSSLPSLAPGGSTPLPLTQVRTYDGRMAESFQIKVSDVSDPASTTGQGFQLLGLTCSLGVMPGPTKLTAGATQ